MAIADVKLISAEEFFLLPDQHVDLVAGEVVRRSPAGARHGFLASTLVRFLSSFAVQRGLGVVVTAEAGFVLSRDPDSVRAPDVAFVTKSRIAPEGIPDGFWPFAPDLAVEVVSPSDSLSEVETRVYEYLDAGCRLVWVVNPRNERVTVYRSASQIRSLTRGEVLSGEDVLPGFELALDDLFRS